MSYTLKLTLLQETQEGNIGSDWRYVLEAKVFNEGLKGEGAISVEKHELDAGVVQEPPGPPEPLVLDAGEGGGECLLRLDFTATEVDLFKNDSGHASMDIKVVLPAEGETTVSQDFEVGAGVRESPGLFNKNAIITLTGRIEVTRN